MKEVQVCCTVFELWWTVVSVCEATAKYIMLACLCLRTLLLQVYDIISPQSHAATPPAYIQLYFINTPAVAESSHLTHNSIHIMYILRGIL